MLGDFARLQEALHTRRLFDGLCEDCLIPARRLGPSAAVIVAVDDNRIVVHNALMRVVQTGQVIVEAVVATVTGQRGS